MLATPCNTEQRSARQILVLRVCHEQFDVLVRKPHIPIIT